jgi:hypothetical protein
MSRSLWIPGPICIDGMSLICRCDTFRDIYHYLRKKLVLLFIVLHLHTSTSDEMGRAGRTVALNVLSILQH